MTGGSACRRLYRTRHATGELVTMARLARMGSMLVRIRCACRARMLLRRMASVDECEALLADALGGSTANPLSRFFYRMEGIQSIGELHASNGPLQFAWYMVLVLSSSTFRSCWKAHASLLWMMRAAVCA